MTQDIDIYTHHITPPLYPLTIDSLTSARAVHSTLRHTYDHNRQPILTVRHIAIIPVSDKLPLLKPTIHVTQTLLTQNLNITQINIHYNDHKNIIYIVRYIPILLTCIDIY